MQKSSSGSEKSGVRGTTFSLKRLRYCKSLELINATIIAYVQVLRFKSTFEFLFVGFLFEFADTLFWTVYSEYALGFAKSFVISPANYRLIWEISFELLGLWLRVFPSKP